MKLDFSRVEPNLVNLICIGVIVLMGELDKDYFFYEICLEIVPLINWIHRN